VTAERYYSRRLCLLLAVCLIGLGLFPTSAEKPVASEPNAPPPAEPNSPPPDPNWREVKAPALQTFCNQWLQLSRRECFEYVARPNRFLLNDDPNLWRAIVPGTERVIVWTYDPNGIRIRDCWIRRAPADVNHDGIVNLKDWTMLF